MTTDKKSNTVIEIYDWYINEYEDNYIVDYKIYKAITSEFFKYIKNDLIENGNKIKLPFNLGNLEIVKSKKWLKSGRLTVDFKTTKELDKIVYYLNEHSDGYKFRCQWSKPNIRNITNIYKYRFVLTRANKRRLAKIIINKERDYIEI